MITLTADDGASFKINGDNVIRIRRVVEGEARFAKTHIDWISLKLAREEPDQVADLVKGEAPHLAELVLPDATPIWFDGRAAKGPIWFDPGQAPDKTKSAFELAGKTQYVSSRPEVVQSIIRQAGGAALPIPSGFLVSLKNVFGSLFGKTAVQGVWD